MGDRLDRIKEILEEMGDSPMQSAKLVAELNWLILEEFRYLRDKNAEQKNAVQEFSRLFR